MLDSGMSPGYAHKVTFRFKNNEAAFQSLFSGYATGKLPRAFPGFLCCCVSS